MPCASCSMRPRATAGEAPGESLPLLQAPSLSRLVDEIAQDGHGLVMVMGKGGVGKTTLAAAVAVELAHRGHEVHLTTSDPAAHLQETLAGTLEHLSVSRIDPHEVTEATASRCWPARAPGSTRRAVHCSKKTCAHPAPRRSRCSRPSRASSARRAASSW
jgi:energy-coupling factor transporter ATP-binding protein EcfA2